MSDIDSPKLGGGAPTASKLWGQVAPTAPPPPGSRVPDHTASQPVMHKSHLKTVRHEIEPCAQRASASWQGVPAPPAPS